MRRGVKIINHFETDCKDIPRWSQLCDCGLNIQMTVASFQIKAATKPAPGYHEVAGHEGCYWALLLFVCTSHSDAEKRMMSKCVSKYWDSLTIPGSGDLTLTVAAAQNSNRWGLCISSIFSPIMFCWELGPFGIESSLDETVRSIAVILFCFWCESRDHKTIIHRVFVFSDGSGLAIFCLTSK